METNTRYARLLTIGKRKAVLLRADFRLESMRVRIRASGNGLVLEPDSKPAFSNCTEWFAAMDACAVSPDFLDDLLEERAAAVRERSRVRRTR